MPRKKQKTEPKSIVIGGAGINGGSKTRLRDMSDERRDALKARILSNEASAQEIAREFNLSTATVYTYKYELKKRGEPVVASPYRARSKAGADLVPMSDGAAPRVASLPTSIQLRDAVTVANSIERDIMAEYTSGRIRELSARDIKSLMLRKMLKGEM